MKQSDFTTFADVWQSAWEIHGKTPTDAAVKLAFNTLKDYPLEKVLAGLGKCLQDPVTGQFIPKPADVIRHIDGDPKHNATGAWAKVMQALEGGGPYVRIVFDDPAIHAALQSVGWSSLCTSTYEQIAFRQKDFEAAYNAAKGTRYYPSYVCAIPSPGARTLYIGNEEQAEEVLKLGQEPRRLQ